MQSCLFFFKGSGELEFEEFCILAARFLIEEDEEQMRKELKEAFRFYDKEGESDHTDKNKSKLFENFTFPTFRNLIFQGNNYSKKSIL